MSTITHDDELALHLYLQQAEHLARYIRLVSGGKLTLAVAENVHVPGNVKDKARIVTGDEWTGAHDYASELGGNSVTQNEFTAAYMDQRVREHEARTDASVSGKQ